MSLSLFVDTGAWKAFIDEKDISHKLVRGEFARCREEKIILETTDYIVSETLTLLRMRPGLGYRVATQFGKMIQTTQVVRLNFVTPELFQRGWEIFEKYSDKDFSFVDCTSFAFMEKKGLREALAFDEHFTQYGFIRRPQI